MVVRATTYTFRAGPAAIIAAWCSFLVSMPTGSQAIPATPFCETAQYNGCYKNEGGIRVTTHEPAGKTLDECHALAADAGRQHFGLEWPQGFPGTARAQCLALDERQWRSMAKVADAECAGAVPEPADGKVHPRGRHRGQDVWGAHDPCRLWFRRGWLH